MDIKNKGKIIISYNNTENFITRQIQNYFSRFYIVFSASIFLGNVIDKMSKTITW